MPSLGAEQSTVQSPMLRYAQQIGWALVPQAEAIKRRGGETGLVFSEQFKSQFIKFNKPAGLNGVHAAELLKRLSALPARIEGNRDMLAILRGETSVYHAGHKREINARVIDFDEPRNNIFEVTPEWSFTNGRDRNRFDVVFLINGLPVLVAETKAAHKPDGIEEGIGQVRRYHSETPEIMAALQLFDVTQLKELWYGVTWSMERKNLFRWRTAEMGSYETAIKAFCDPQRILRYLGDFILFATKDDELHKYILRQHQTRAVDKVVARCADPKKTRALVWHTQGSGKTFTMITAAHKLLEDPAFGKPTVLMLVDRNELESQLFGHLTGVGVPHTVAESKKHVQELLADDYRGLIVSMIHKFEGIPKDLNTRDDVFVLIDEAHRSTGGDLGNYLLAALPNATWIGFTGTPIDKTAHGKGTFKTFGVDDKQGYLDKYSIKESVEDGTTLKLHYEIAPNELKVDRELLETEFLTLAEAQGVSDIDELNAILDRAVTLKTAMKNSNRVENIARFVAEHFREKIQPMGFKAFLVGVDRAACALYKKALDRYLPAEWSQVVYTSIHNDSEDLKLHRLEETQEKRIRKAFAKPDIDPQILIVTEKLLTGYDAPVLYCMYLDKPMRDHVLLQAIARVNRPYEEADGRVKPAGFVLDFVGIFENLQQALAFDSEEVESVIENIDLLKATFKVRLGEMCDAVLPAAKGHDDKAVEAAVQAFSDRKQRLTFYNKFKDLERMYEVISPDAFLRDFMDDYLWIARLYELVRNWFSLRPIVDKELLRKTRALVQKHVTADDPAGPLKRYEINEGTLQALHSTQSPDGVKIINLAKSLAGTISAEESEKPHLRTIGERVEEIVQRYDERQVDTKTALDALEEMVREYNEARRQEKAKGFDQPTTFSIYWLLRQQCGCDDSELAIELDRTIGAHPYRDMNPENMRQLRLRLTVALIKPLGKEKVADAIDRLLALDRKEP
ncbi:MAG TPA: HsdR family type I site-specific deoxyribonuclease [Pirellulales bacterium]|nr:HsdR family type I site-specific deoxyribonuclease [Pirellulales bacterium]